MKCLKVIMAATLIVAITVVINIGDVAAYHSADYKPADYKIGLTELLRVIQLYGNGTYHCDSGGEDGYAPGDGDRTCDPHDSDYSPQDWKLGLTELLRMIQIYSSSEYHASQGGEDGFATGPVQEDPDSAVYPMFTDDNGNGINDYLEEETHFSGSESPASSRSSRNPAHHGGQPDSGYAMQQGRALYGHAFTDMDGDGVCDYGQNGSGTWHGPGFTDGDQDGVCDYWDADSPLYNHHQGMYFQDQNLNMINDYSESQWHDGHGHSFTDTDGDGVCDYAQNGTDTCWHGPGFTDGDSNGVCDHWDVGGWGHGSHHYRP